MSLDELMRNKGRGEALRIIAESAYFDAMSITHVLANYLSRKYNENVIYNYHSPGSGEYVYYTIEKLADPDTNVEIFSTKAYGQYNFNEIHLLAFEDMLSELGKQLFSNPNLWIVDRSQANGNGCVIRHESVFDRNDKYPEAKDFINYLFELQVQNNGKHLNYAEMKRALNDFLESEKQKEVKTSEVKVRKIKKPKK